MHTVTTTATNTIHARRVASKVGTDLKRMQRLWGSASLTNERIDAYEKEAALLLENGYLKEVIYGFINNTSGKWRHAVKYEAYYGQLIGGGDDPGDILPADVSGCRFKSFLTFSQEWDSLSDIAQKEFENKLPFRRSCGKEPDVEEGKAWVADNQRYSSGQTHLGRFSIASYS